MTSQPLRLLAADFAPAKTRLTLLLATTAEVGASIADHVPRVT